MRVGAVICRRAQDKAHITSAALLAVLPQIGDDIGSAKLQDLFLSNVSKRAAEDIREEMDIMGPVAKSRIRAAQERIVAAALTLAEDGSIYLPMGAEDDEG